MEKKYEITSEAHPAFPRCHRIRALRDIPAVGVKMGDLGGFVESEKNLSQCGNCWIFDSAIAMDNAWVTGNAQMHGHSQMFDNAKLWDYSQMWDNSQMFGSSLMWDNSQMFDDSQMWGSSRMSGNSKMFDNAKMWDDSQMFGSSRISGDSKMFGNSKLTGKAINIIGIFPWDVTIVDDHMIVGCECHSFDEWRNFSNEEIAAMNEKALEHYQKVMTIMEVVLKSRN